MTAVAIAALAIVVSACASPAGSGSPSPDAMGAPEWKSATSTRFGYALDVPGHYAYTAATEDWPAGVYPVADAPYSDLWSAAIGFPTIDISTQELPEGMTEGEFLAWLDAENATICTVEEVEEVTVDGAVGRWQRQTCGYNSFEVTVFHAERVYLIYWLGNRVDTEDDREAFAHVISTFQFDPSSSE